MATSRWCDRDVRKYVAFYAGQGIAEDLALRDYTTRLLGSDPDLVRHGGGNTSLKTRIPDLTGEPCDVLCVKGSGWDMEFIEPAGLPAVRMDGLLRARTFESLGDEQMVRLLRAGLIDPSAPTPSVETLLHAFLPHRYVDHTHSTAILSLVNQPDGQSVCRDVFGSRMGIVDYVEPGFDLACAAAAVHDSNPDVVGLILDKHGIFTFGETAETSYRRMIECARLAADHIARGRAAVFVPRPSPRPEPAPQTIGPCLRGAVGIDLGEGRWRRFVLHHRITPDIAAYVDNPDLADLATRGVSTPDMVLRTKQKPLIAPRYENPRQFRREIRRRAAAYMTDYRAYFARCDALDDVQRIMLDPAPRVALVPGAGLFGIGRTHRDAVIAADLAETSMRAIVGAERIGSFTPLGDTDLFRLEYWSLEQAKLASAVERPLTGQVAVVTGGGGTIGRAIARTFAAAGAHVAVIDMAAAAAEDAARAAGNGAIAVPCDLTDHAAVSGAFDEVAATFGGVDIAISNAGAAVQGAMATVSGETLRESFEINFFAHQTVAQTAVRIMREQGTGGVLLFNTSKQAVNPGRGFGPYGTAKAATLFLSRQYALEYGRDGIRSNAVNADRIRSGLLSDAMIRERAAARGVDAGAYMTDNLLGLEVSADHVAQTFLDQALSERTTGNVVTVDGGNMAAALR